jgi:hypothetical protein
MASVRMKREELVKVVSRHGRVLRKFGWQILCRGRRPNEDGRRPFSFRLRSRTSESEAVPSLEMRHSERLKSMSPFLADEASGVDVVLELPRSVAMLQEDLVTDLDGEAFQHRYKR